MDLLESIQAKGERITMSRRVVIDALGQAHDHLTIADIQQHIQQRNSGYVISDTTIYRVLQWLKDLALVSQTDIGQVGIVYALNDVSHHHHLICLTCHSIFTIDDEIFESLRDRLQADYGFVARMEHMAIYGQCRNCSTHRERIDIS